MADLGAIGKKLPTTQPALQVATPFGNGGRSVASRSAGTNTSVSGTVREMGAAASGKLVRVYDPVSGMFVGQTTSAGDGTYSVKTGGFPAVFVVAFDPTTYQMAGYDRVTPG